MDGFPYKDLVEWASRLSPAAIFLFFLFMERRERLSRQEKMDMVTERSIKAIADTAAAVTALKDWIIEERHRGRP